MPANDLRHGGRLLTVGSDSLTLAINLLIAAGVVSTNLASPD